MIGTTFTHNGVTLRITEYSAHAGEYTLVSDRSGGVWFATAAQLEAVGVTVV